jgi:glutamyl-tRNA reductase
MHLLLVGMDHRTALVAEREALSLGETDALRVLSGLSAFPAVREAIVLSTCNRTELYAATEDLAAARRALRLVVATVKGQDLLAPALSLIERTDEAVVTHLFRVASGLESMVVGEPQILSQVKDAHGRARRVGSTGPWLDRLFESALRTGKRARAETAIGVGVVSVASAACELARRHIDSLEGRSVLVIGVGETARIAATHLTHHSPAVTIANRTVERAQSLAGQVGASAAIGLDNLEDALATADLVFSATSSPHAIVTETAVRRAMSERGDRKLVVIDVAVPRDVDAEVAAVPGVVLHTIDDIQTVVDRSLAKRAGEVPQVEAVILDEATRFDAWGRARVARARAAASPSQAGHVVA